MAEPIRVFDKLRVPSLEDEVADFRGLSPEEKAVLLRAAVRVGVRLLEANPHRERVLEYRDPWPEATSAILRGARGRGK